MALRVLLLGTVHFLGERGGGGGGWWELGRALEKNWLERGPAEKKWRKGVVGLKKFRIG